MPTLRLLAAASLLCGSVLFIMAVLLGQPPTWLAKYELIVLAAAAMAYGFSGYLPPVFVWLRCRPIRGAAYLLIGAVAMHLPANLVISCLFLAGRLRHSWKSGTMLSLIAWS